MGSRAVFIDRDGTINKNTGYIDTPDRFEIYPGVAEGIKKLKKNGYKIIIITNQSGIARGFFTVEKLEKIHEKMKKILSDDDDIIDAIYYCPHHPDEKCDCRKPNTQLFEKAIKEHKIETGLSYMMGDRMLDVEAGSKVGLKTVLIPEKKEMVRIEMEESEIKPDHISKDFKLGVEWIINNNL